MGRLLKLINRVLIFCGLLFIALILFASISIDIVDGILLKTALEEKTLYFEDRT